MIDETSPLDLVHWKDVKAPPDLERAREFILRSTTYAPTHLFAGVDFYRRAALEYGFRAHDLEPGPYPGVLCLRFRDAVEHAASHPELYPPSVTIRLPAPWDLNQEFIPISSQEDAASAEAAVRESLERAGYFGVRFTDAGRAVRLLTVEWNV